MFNQKQLIFSNFKKALPLFILLILLSGLSCGKRAVPLPPVERVQQRVEIAGNQRGNLVILSWTMPARNASDGSILNINHIDVYRLIEPADTVDSLSEESFAARSTLISSVPVSKTDFARQLYTFSDTLKFAGQNVRLRYAIRFVNNAGQKAAFSNFLLLEPTSKIADQPNDLSAEVLESSIKLNWEAPQMNVDGTKPANILGYNIYSVNEENETKLENLTPVNSTQFFDKSFKFGTNYQYFVRTVSLSRNGEPVESLNSNTIEVLPKDVFAPSAPSALTIAAAPNNLSIFFAVNPETDIAGYNIYRSTNPNLKKSEWTLLNPELLKTNTFKDTKVESGKTYYYYLTAVDINGNTSLPSEIVSETAP